jgi:hypothetical protein
MVDISNYLLWFINQLITGGQHLVLQGWYSRIYKIFHTPENNNDLIIFNNNIS